MTDTPYPTDIKRPAPPDTRACPVCGLVLSSFVTECPQDGTRLPLAIESDATFSHKYKFLSTIGSGGMGVIYKARQLAMNKIVAIKMLHSEIPSDEALRRFQVEGKAAGILNHKYIIQVHDLGVTDSGRPFMVMDYIDGQTLAEELSARGPLKVERFLRLFVQVCEALSHAHSKGVLHRDLKPSNLMLLQTGRTEEVRIMDFGIAKLLEGTEYDAQRLTKTGEALGSPLYMSPEQCRSAKLDRRSDLYALGCVMYEALTGAPPFMGKTALETVMMHLDQEPITMSSASLGLKFDQGLEDIVLRLLRKEPADRYQSSEEVESDLIKYQEAITGGEPVRFVYAENKELSQSKAQPAPARKRWSTRDASVVGIILIAVAVVAGTVLAG